MRRSATALAAVAVAVALLLAGCHESTTSKPAPPPHRPQLVRVRVQPAPEGPTREWTATGTSGAQAATLRQAMHLLPIPLPKPVAQPANCQPSSPTATGTLFDVELSDGTAQTYGPCAFPPSLDQFRALILAS